MALNERYMFDRPFPTPEGVAMGGFLIMKRKPDGSLDLKKGRKKYYRFLTFFYGKPPSAFHWDCICRASEMMRYSDDDELEETMREYQSRLRVQMPILFDPKLFMNRLDS